MNGREALKALADGKRVREQSWQLSEYVALNGKDEIVDENGKLAGETVAFSGEGWEIVEQPATDEALIAEMEHLAGFYIDQSRIQSAAYAHCARMLRERKAKP